jgi:hypothetical protein
MGTCSASILKGYITSHMASTSVALGTPALYAKHVLVPKPVAMFYMEKGLVAWLASMCGSRICCVRMIDKTYLSLI